MAGDVAKLTITQFDVSTKAVNESMQFAVMLNPSGYSQALSVEYDVRPAFGRIPQTRFVSSMPETLELEELVLDGTGVLGAGPDVMEQVSWLRAVAYEPPQSTSIDLQRPVVQVSWGSLLFIGRIEEMTVKYTLFAPNGRPLRARVKLGFTEYQPEAEEEQDTAPAGTLEVAMADADSLPLKCFELYGDPNACMEVALFNGLTSFRDIPAGTVLRFPPGL